MVARTDRMGDLILTAPLIEALKRHFPRTRISLLASAANAQVAPLLPAIDAVEVDSVEARDSRWRGTLALARRLRQLDIDVMLFANSKHRLAVSAWLARIPVRIGSAGRAYSMLYTARVKAPRFEHETDRALRLLQPLGVQTTPATAPRCTVAEDDRRAVADLLARHGVGATDVLAIVHPSNSGNALTGSSAWYAELADELHAAGYVVMLTGTQADRQLTAAIAAAAQHPPLDLSGQLTVGELAALLGRGNICIGNSTGPAHLAAAVGVPTIGLYSPLIKQHRWLPRGSAIQVLRPELGMSCATCLGVRCQFFNCMDRITPARVIAAVAVLQARAHP